jgi:type II secretion system protein H
MKDRGFSFIELIVVLVLISLSVALVAPSLSRFSKAVELKAAAKKIVAILRYYRSEAVNQGKVYQVLFDSDLREVKVQPMESVEEEKKEEKAPRKTYVLPTGVQIKEVKVESPQYPTDFPTIEFYPNGGSNGGAILLDTREDKGFKIKVHFLTGSVAMEKG